MLLDAANKELCIIMNIDEIVIIGGGYLFRDTLSITNKLVLTNVNCEYRRRCVLSRY